MPRPTFALPARLTAALACSCGGLAVGCIREADVRPADIRTYTVPRASARPARGTPPPAEAAASQDGAATRLGYDVPAGWTDRGGSGMRLATLAIGDPAEGCEVTVIPASGTLRGNVERWHGQLDPQAAPEASRQAVDAALAAAETVAAGPLTATVVMLRQPGTAGPDTVQAILGAMIPLAADGALFVKFKGDAAVAIRERGNFVRFVSSIRWNEPARP